MRFIATGILIACAVSVAFASALPLTAKEIALMLRSGYSSETVLHELSARRFADSFDAATEKQLLQAGANPSLIEALRSGSYQASASQIAAIKAKSLAKEENVGKQTKRSDEVVSQSQPSSPAVPPPDAIYSRLKGDLVYWHQGNLVPFDDEALERKKLYLLFFSANWSPPGRKFGSQLVDYYNRVAPQHPEFEVIFFSADRSQFAMESYIAQNAMPWPVVAYDKLSGKAGDIKNGLVREIPCLILADASGKVLSYSHGGDTPATVEQVLGALDQILAQRGQPAR